MLGVFLDFASTLGYPSRFLRSNVFCAPERKKSRALRCNLNSAVSSAVLSAVRSSVRSPQSNGRGCSSVGRALEWHSRGQGFDSPHLHGFLPGSGMARPGRDEQGAGSPVRAVKSVGCGNSSVGRAQPCQGWGRGFESRFPLFAAGQDSHPHRIRKERPEGARKFRAPRLGG